jgi:hypothetical protein
MDEVGAELFGSFSPHVGSSSTPLVLPDTEGEASAKVVSPVLQIMPELRVLCGESVSPVSMEQLKLGSLQASEVDLVSSPPPWSLVRLRRWTWCPHHPSWSLVRGQKTYLSVLWSVEF